MSTSVAKSWGSVAVGGALAVVYLTVALSCMSATSSAHYLLTATPAHTRAMGLVPYVVLALGLLLVGLAARRWWQAPIAPVLLVAGGFWWSTWLMNLPRRTVEHDWTAARATDVANQLGTVWAVIGGLLVIGGWGLVRRGGWWWALGLLPSAMVLGVTAALLQATAPGPVSGYSSIEAAARAFSRSYRIHQAEAIVVNTLVVVACVWLCALIGKAMTVALRPQPVAGHHQLAAAPTHRPPAVAAPPVFVAPPSVADEIRKLAELRAAGELTDAEFERQKARLLG